MFNLIVIFNHIGSDNK